MSNMSILGYICASSICTCMDYVYLYRYLPNDGNDNDLGISSDGCDGDKPLQQGRQSHEGPGMAKMAGPLLPV